LNFYSIERVSHFVVALNFYVILPQLCVDVLHSRYVGLAEVTLQQLLYAFLQLQGVNRELLPQLHQELLLKLPVVQPHLHFVDEPADAFRLEVAEVGHFGVLRPNMFTFFLKKSMACSTKSLIILSFCCAGISSFCMIVRLTAFISSMISAYIYVKGCGS